MKKLFFVLLFSIGLLACDKDSVYDNAVIGKESSDSFTNSIEEGTPYALLICSPVTGTVIEILVTEGQNVAAGQIICTIEDKRFCIFNEIESSISGAIKKISVNAGQPVEYGDLLFTVTGAY